MSLETLLHKPTYVPNEFPTTNDPSGKRIAIIGEAPGEDEVTQRRPFVGVSGRLLSVLLQRVGIVRSACFVGNVCQIRPPGNDIKVFSHGGEELTHGLTQLQHDLNTFNPNIVICLGGTALSAFLSSGFSISAWRGTLFTSNTLLLAGRKCIATYHPAAILRMYSWMPYVLFDLQRAASEATTSELVLPQRNFELDLSGQDIVDRLNAITPNQLVSFDIEGGTYGIPCCSVSVDKDRAFIIPFKRGGTEGFDFETESAVWAALARVLSDSRIPKVLQNSLYDRFVLAYNHGILIRNVVDDTMLKHWELYSEMEKNLGVQASIYTKEPYYKHEGKNDSERTFHTYCCKDSAVTYEINTVLEERLSDQDARKHYLFNMSLLNPLLYMELRGIRYDDKKAKNKVARLTTEANDLQRAIDSTLAGKKYGPKKQTYLLNVASNAQMKEYLYKDRGFETFYKRQTKHTKGEERKVTCDYESLLKTAKRTNDPVVLNIISLRSIRTRLSMLQIKSDNDGRIRCGYNVVGTVSGRLSCYTSPTGSGYNLQTIPEEDRDLFIADDGYYFFQCDLSGADGWTVAAHCARLGDPTMLDDLKSGIKIAKVIALMFKRGPQTSRLPREELLTLCNEIAKDDPIYFGSKCCQHGSNYGMGKILLSMTIFKESEGKVQIDAATAERLQKFYFMRYPGVLVWHRWVAQQLIQNKKMKSASGHTRRFFGRPEDNSTLKDALANEPQENTTYATNLAAMRLWNDPQNRRSDGSLILEPLHQVHDALAGQFRQEDIGLAFRKIPEWFQNELNIGGVTLIIPYEGRYGKSWGELTEKI